MKYDKLYNEAENYYMIGEYEKALSIFIESYKLKEDNDCLNYIGCCYLAMKDYGSAINIFKKLINLFPYVERPVFNLGRVYLKQNYLKDAFDCFEKAILINPNSEDAHYYMGVYYEKIDEFKQASIYYEKSISLNFEQAEAHLNLGICYTKMRNYQRAITEFDISYSQDNSSRDALFNKAMVLLRMKDYNRAIEVLLYVIKFEPDNIGTMVDIADSYLRINDLDNSKKWIDEIFLKDPANITANKLLRILSVLEKKRLNGEL